MIIVEGVEDILQILSDFKALNTMYVEDVEDILQILSDFKALNTMYVKDVEDIKTSHNRFLTDFLEFI